MGFNQRVFGWLFICAGAAGCGGSGPTQTVVDTGAGDTIVGPSPPPPDTAGPVDSIPPEPPDTNPPPAVIPVHVGIPFGPYALPPEIYGQSFNGAYRPRWNDRSLLTD